jgi:hypothetical protein
MKSFCGGSRGAVFSKSAPLAAGGSGETIFIVFGIIFIALPGGILYNAGGWFKMKNIVKGKMMLMSYELDTLIRDVNIKLNQIKGG